MKYAVKLHDYLTSENPVAVQSVLVAALALVISSVLLSTLFGLLGSPEVDESPPTLVDFVSIVLLAPLFETLVLLLSLELSWLVLRNRLVVTLLVGFGWAAAHSSVRLTWGVGVVTFFLIASYLYLYWRGVSRARAVQLLLFPHVLINLAACALWWAAD
ncbi:hypothetical protein [Pseudomonas citronellolis]|uniref:hypothetical protein n=1 Tax=Pseudomonas citronellolis TaxID=53408 RepID=UPI0023E45A8E|nr:hypothetical protein [Pseudomonas citronellolis]MDF3932297.1 hypothetical protein [Pseudomonas citronellolis]